MQLWENWSMCLSADQLVPVIIGIQLHLAIAPSYKEVLNSFPKIREDPYLETLLRNFFRSYKQGEISLTLTNQVKLDELSIKKVKKLKRYTLIQK